MKKYYEAEVNVSLKFKIGIPADSREEAAEKLRKITRNNGENPDNFSGKCECGGSLKYVQNLDDHVVDEVDPTIG